MKLLIRCCLLLVLLVVSSVAPASVAPGGNEPGNPSKSCNNGGSKGGGCPPAAPSILNPLMLLYIHDATIYAAPTGPLSTSGACAPCGASVGTGSQQGVHNLASIEIKRYLRSRSGGFLGSLGNNHYLGQDRQIRLDWSAGNPAAVSMRQFVPENAAFKHDFLPGTTANGILYDAVGWARDARMFNAAGTLTAQATQAVWLVVYDSDGTCWTYEIFDAGYGATARAGRLTRVSVLPGVITQNIAYAYGATQTIDDPARRWQISQITAADGTIARFTYDNTVQRGGRYAVTRIDLPNGSFTTFSYYENEMTANVLPDGTSATFSPGKARVNNADCIRTAIWDPAAEPNHQWKSVAWTDGLYTASNGVLTPQSYGHLRQVSNALGEPMLLAWGSQTIVNNASATIWWAPNEGLMRYDTTDAAILPTMLARAPSFTLGQNPFAAAFTQRIQFIADVAQEKEVGIYDERGTLLRRTYDPFNGRITREVGRDGAVTTTTYNQFAQPLVVTDALGRQTTYTYDSAGNRLSKTVGSGSELGRWSWTYDARGLVLSATDANGNRSDYGYDANGRLTTVTEPADAAGGSRAVRTFAYDAAGRVLSATDAGGRSVTMAYDARNRVTLRTYADASTETVTYGANAMSGLVVATTDRNGRRTTYGYDPAGRLIHTEVAAGTAEVQVEDCTYLAGSFTRKLVCVRDGEKTVNAYDNQGNLIASTVYPKVGTALTSTTQYDVARRPWARQDPFGRWTYQVYDAEGRPVRTVRELTPGAVAATGALAAGLPATYAPSLAPGTAWTAQALGAPALAGSTTVAAGVYTQVGSGSNFWGVSDQGQFYARPVLGDCALTVRVASLTAPNPWSKAGIMLRASADPAAAYVGAFVTPSGVTIQSRGDSGAVTTWSGAYDLPGTAPAWLRIVRTAGTTVVSVSADGATWTSQTFTWLQLGLGSRLGLATSSLDATKTCTARFDNLTHSVVATPEAGIADAGVIAALQALPRITTANPAYSIEELAYDAAGAVVSTTAGSGVATVRTYDSQGRVSTETEAAGTTEAATTSFTYDPQGNRTVIRSPANRLVTQTFTGRNLLLTRTEGATTAEAGTTRWTYTPTRQVATVTDALGRVTTSAYGVCCDRLTQVTDPAGFITRFAYDAVGNRLTTTDGNGLTFATVFDSRNRPVRSTDAAGQVTTIAYDANLTDGVGIDAVAAVRTVATSLGLGAGADGQAVAITDPALQTIYELRDGLGRIVARIDGLGQVTRQTYDVVVGGLVESTVVDPLGNTVRTRSDGAGRIRQQLDASGALTTTATDAVGNVLSVRDPLQVGWDATYDRRNRQVSRTTTRAATTATTYDADGNLLSESDALGGVAWSGYDARHRKLWTQDRIGAITRFAYDAVGNLVQISDADNDRAAVAAALANGLAKPDGCTLYAYDVRNLLVAEVFPLGQAGRTLRKYAYDGGRRLTGRTVGLLSGAFGATAAFSGTPEATTYAYDAANRLITRGYADGKNDSFAYDAASRLTTAGSARYGTTVTRVYDAANRLLRETLDVGAVASYAPMQVSYGYDAANRLTSLTYPDGTTIGRSYGARGELTQITDQGANVQVRAYDAAGRLTTATAGNATIETRTYVTGSSLVATIRVPGVTDFAYQYDANDRKTVEQDKVTTGNSQRFGYDAQSRLSSWKLGSGILPADPSTLAQTWSLSPVGDWTSLATATTSGTTTTTTTQARTHTAVHELIGIGATALTYDAKGNLTRDDQGQTFTWDPENRLASAGNLQQGQGTSAAYAYDALGRRVRAAVTTGTTTETTTFVSAGAQEVVAITGDLTAFGDPAADPEGAGAAPFNPSTGQGARGSLLADPTATRVNFQPAATDTPDGWSADTGAVRATATARGWTTAATGTDRRQLGRPLYDSFIALGTATWQIPVANGAHAVVIMCGDAASRAQTNHLLVNGVSIVDPTPYDGRVTNGYETGSFDGYALTVNVTNGLLTIRGGTGAMSPKINFIEIGAVGSATSTTLNTAVAAAATQATKDTAKAKAKTPPAVKRNVWGSYVDELVSYTVKKPRKSATRYFTHANHLYSPAALTDQAGVVVERYSYEAYGAQTITAGVGGAVRSKSAVGFDRGFTGQIRDIETGLNYVRARMYSPTLGRFVSRDPMLYHDGLSLYCAYYVPYRLDPFGTITLEEAESHWRGKTGTPMSMPFSDLGADSVKASDFPKYSNAIAKLREKVSAPCCADQSDPFTDKMSWSPSGDIWYVLGHVTLKVSGTLSLKCKNYSGRCFCDPHFKGTLKSYDDTYDFDMKSWVNPGNWPRNVETILGRMHAGDGKAFDIQIRGERQLDE